MASNSKKHRLNTAIENISAAALGSLAGYSAGAGASHLAVTRGPYSEYLQKLPKREALKKLRRTKDLVSVGAAGVGSVAGLVARQRMRSARKKDLTEKLADLRWSE